MRRILIALGLCLVIPMLAPCQKPHRVAIRAGKLIDGKSEKPFENALIVIESDRIVSVVAGGSAPAGVDVIDLSKATVLPGFIDTHTHVLLQGDITAEEYDAQLLKESIPYRAILAARNAQIALSHGFTAISVARLFLGAKGSYWRAVCGRSRRRAQGRARAGDVRRRLD